MPFSKAPKKQAENRLHSAAGNEQESAQSGISQFQPPLLQFWAGGALSPVIQRNATPSPVAYQGFDQIKALTLSDFKAYCRTQADWQAAPSLTDPQRAVLREILMLGNEDVETILGTTRVRDFVAQMDAEALGSEVADERASAIRDYCSAASSTELPFKITHTATTLANVITVGRSISLLKDVFPVYVLRSALKEREFNQLRSQNYLQALIDYYQNAQQRPIFQATNGSDFESYIYLRREGKNPLDYDGTNLKGKVRNYHRFEKNALDRLDRNYGDTSKSKPLTLILHTSIDHNGAFHRDPNFTAVVRDARMLTLMVEGFESLSEFQSQIGPLATTYGQNNRIDQIMIAGHGNAQSMQLAGTITENPDSPNQVQEVSNGLNVRQAADVEARLIALGWSEEDRQRFMEGFNRDRQATDNLLNEVLSYMDTSSTDAASRQPHNRIIFNACLTGSNVVRSAIASGDQAAAQTAVRDYIRNNPSLATYMQNLASGRPVTSVGANASFGQVSLLNPRGELDIISAGDPAITANKLRYVEFGTEPSGALRAVLESWANNATDTIAAMQRRVRQSPGTDWDKRLIRKAYQIIIAQYSTNAEAIRLLGSGVEILAELKSSPHFESRESFFTTFVNGSAVNNLNTADLDAILAVLAGSAEFTGTPGLRLAVFQRWMKINAAKKTDFMSMLQSRTCSDCLRFISISLLDGAGLMQDLLSGSFNDNAKLKLALMGVIGANDNTHARSHLMGLLAGATSFPAALRVGQALGTASNEAAILQKLGVFSAPAAPSSSSSAPPPAPTANTRIHGETDNSVFIESRHQVARGANPYGASIRIRPDAASTEVGTLLYQQSAYSIGETGDWIAIEHTFTGETRPETAFVSKFSVDLVDAYA